MVFFELADDEFDLLELFAASADLPSFGGVERFFDASAVNQSIESINIYVRYWSREIWVFYLFCY